MKTYKHPEKIKEKLKQLGLEDLPTLSEEEQDVLTTRPQRSQDVRTPFYVPMRKTSR